MSLVHFVKQDHGIRAFPQQLENKSPRWLGTATAEKLAFYPFPCPLHQDHGIGAFPQQLENKSPKMVGYSQQRNWHFILSLVHFIKQDHGIGAFPQQLENKSPRWLSTATAEKLAFYPFPCPLHQTGPWHRGIPSTVRK